MSIRPVLFGLFKKRRLGVQTSIPKVERNIISLLYWTAVTLVSISSESLASYLLSVPIMTAIVAWKTGQHGFFFCPPRRYLFLLFLFLIRGRAWATWSACAGRRQTSPRGLWRRWSWPGVALLRSNTGRSSPTPRGSSSSSGQQSSPVLTPTGWLSGDWLPLSSRYGTETLQANMGCFRMA